jgi:hypothetical protein
VSGEDETRRESYPRALDERERAWCAWLLPRERAAYAALASAIDELLVLGLGRWGAGDLVLGAEGQTIDLEAPMKPVAAYGELAIEGNGTLSISIHRPDDEGRIEMHCSGADLTAPLTASSRWCYSYWQPGEPSPSTGGALREIALDDTGELVLALDASRRTLWLHDRTTKGNTLIPVTNLYNELMLLKGVRDPSVALEHRRLFDAPAENSDAEVRDAFRRYNSTWRKVDAGRLATAAAHVEEPGLLARIGRALRGGPSR